MDGIKNDVNLTLSSALWPELKMWFHEHDIEWDLADTEYDDGWRRVIFSGVQVSWMPHAMLQLTAPDKREVLEPSPQTWFIINPHHYAGYSETKP
jgi:hypothetical protein